jgi:hypothetical protein
VQTIVSMIILRTKMNPLVAIWYRFVNDPLQIYRSGPAANGPAASGGGPAAGGPGPAAGGAGTRAGRRGDRGVTTGPFGMMIFSFTAAGADPRR